MSPRGQATVELALGGVLLITIVMLGLWLTEVSFLSIKVQEAASAAVWDATGRPVDDFTEPTDTGATRRNYNQLLVDVPRDVGDRYRNFDGLNGGGSGTARVFTEGKALQVRCEATGPTTMTFNVPANTQYRDRTGMVPGRVNAQLRQWYQPRGATMCTASAVASAWQLPKTFLDKPQGGAFTQFREDKLLRLCGAGKAIGGGCSAGYPVLLGDWALDGKGGTRVVRDSVLPQSVGVTESDGNVPYRTMVRTMFEKSGERYGANEQGSGASGRFASKLAAQRPPGFSNNPVTHHTDRKFYMSYAGSEHNYVDMLEFDQSLRRDCLKCHFNTAGTQPVNGNPEPKDKADDWRTRRKPCFLGLGGCRP